MNQGGDDGIEGLGPEWRLETIRQQKMESFFVKGAVRSRQLPLPGNLSELIDLRIGFLERHCPAANHRVRDREQKRMDVDHDRFDARVATVQIVREPTGTCPHDYGAPKRLPLEHGLEGCQRAFVLAVRFDGPPPIAKQVVNVHEGRRNAGGRRVPGRIGSVSRQQRV